MKEKTAVQKYLDKIKMVSYMCDDPANEMDLKHCMVTLIGEAKELLELEKKQVMDAYQEGYANTCSGCDSGCGANFYLDTSAETYFTDTYEQPK